MFVHRQPKSSVAECCRAIRTNLLFMSPDKPFKTLVVTSSGPQEGKSTTCIFLGVAMAQSGNRVLLLDTDMRRPRLHKAFGVPNDVGISSLVVGEGTLDKAVKSTEVPNLFVLPCGPMPPNPAELLHTQAFAELLKAAGEKFDRIILDSPPLNPVSDSAVLATQADGVVLVLRAGKTHREAARRALRSLADVQAQMYGAILNDLDVMNPRYRRHVPELSRLLRLARRGGEGRGGLVVSRAGAGLRVLHLGKFYPPASGGMEGHVQTLARAQAALGARVEVLCINHAAAEQGVSHEFHGRSPTREEWDGPVRVIRVGRWASVLRMDVMPELPRELVSALARGVDVVHLHTPNPTHAAGAGGGAVAAARLHHPPQRRHPPEGGRRALPPLRVGALRRARGRLIATSSAYVPGSPLLQRFREKVRELPLGIDLSPYLHALARGAGGRGPLALAAGLAAVADGGAARLLQGPVHRARGADASARPLWWWARGRWSRRAGRARGRLAWRGACCGRATCRRSELTGAYRAATALWFPSNARSEAYGLSQIEAMASGLPVINTAIPHSGVPWVSLHEETGLTVPVDDAEALARAARRLLEEPGLAERLGQGARARAVEQFRHDVMAERSLTLYADALADSPSGPLPSRFRGRKLVRCGCSTSTAATSTVASRRSCGRWRGCSGCPRSWCTSSRSASRAG